MFTNRVFTKMVLITLQNSLAGQAVQTLVYTLNNVNIGSVSHDQTLTEDLSLRFRSGQISYRDPGNGHSTSFEFDTVALV
jgi:type VI protein secretion system component Hcp